MAGAAIHPAHRLPHPAPTSQRRGQRYTQHSDCHTRLYLVNTKDSDKPSTQITTPGYNLSTPRTAIHPALGLQHPNESKPGSNKSHPAYTRLGWIEGSDPLSTQTTHTHNRLLPMHTGLTSSHRASPSNSKPSPTDQ